MMALLSNDSLLIMRLWAAALVKLRYFMGIFYAEGLKKAHNANVPYKEKSI